MRGSAKESFELARSKDSTTEEKFKLRVRKQLEEQLLREREKRERATRRAELKKEREAIKEYKAGLIGRRLQKKRGLPADILYRVRDYIDHQKESLNDERRSPLSQNSILHWRYRRR